MQWRHVKNVFICVALRWRCCCCWNPIAIHTSWVFRIRFKHCSHKCTYAPSVRFGFRFWRWLLALRSWWIAKKKDLGIKWDASHTRSVSIVSIRIHTLMDFTSLSMNALKHRFTRQFTNFTYVHSHACDLIELEYWLRYQFIFNSVRFLFSAFTSANSSCDATVQTYRKFPNFRKNYPVVFLYISIPFTVFVLVSK